MNRGFEASFRRHLAQEQRRAVLDALAEKIDPGTTLGQIVDIATALGWGDGVGGLSLSDLADALLTAEPDDEPALAEAEEDEDVEEEAAPAPAPARGRKAKPAPPAKKGGRAAKGKAKPARAEKPEPPAPEKAERAKVGARTKPGKGGKITIDERMSLQEAADVFLPLVRGLGRATMQDIEDATSGGRRKLRFHIGQLVKHGHLERHGMGRGTYYTVA